MVTLALLVAGILAARSTWRGAAYLQVFSLSASYLLLMVFATTETLTRVPVGSPFASSATDPALTPVRLGLLTVFVLGLGLQLLKLRAARANGVGRLQEPPTSSKEPVGRRPS